LATLFVVLTSQPLSAEPSQLPYPELHAIAQLPDWHSGVPSVPLQVVPHPPQLVGSEAVFVSHPLPIWTSQSTHPGLHEAIVQLPEEQPAVPFGMLQEFPQLPQ